MTPLRTGYVAVQTFYEISLGFLPPDAVNVTLEAPVGIIVEPEILQFDHDNWNVAQRVRVHITTVFPAAPIVSHICYQAEGELGGK